MRCVRNKWGTGTTCEKVPETSATKEINSRLATMVAEREQQDKMWQTTPTVEKNITNEKNMIITSEFFIKSQNVSSIKYKDG